MEKILVINPGSTSTKIACYEDNNPIFVESIEHSQEQLSPYKEIMDQYKMRKEVILEALNEHKVNYKELTCVVSRGGLLPPVKHGAYEINDDMVWQLTYAPQNNHASNLGAVIAKSIGDELNIKTYIYDAVTVDEMEELAKVTGFPDIKRKGMGHNLNMRAAALRYAEENEKNYDDVNVIVAHLGGGITLSLHNQGRITDMISDDEGPFSPERAGGLPVFQVLEMACEKLTYKQAMKKVRSQGGFMAYFNHTDARDVEAVYNTDPQAKLIYDALALNIARNIAKLAVYVNGNVDAIILTGGIAYSKLLTNMVAERVSFINDVTVYPGEDEMKSLANGALRVLSNQEEAHTFKKVTK